MHDEDLKNAIFTSIFDDEDTYRRLYVPTVFHMRKNPKDGHRVDELVDNAVMKYCKKNNLDYNQIPQEVKKSVVIDLYQEMIDNEN
jgi:hypothetical protein